MGYAWLVGSGFPVGLSPVDVTLNPGCPNLKFLEFPLYWSWSIIIMIRKFGPRTTAGYWLLSHGFLNPILLLGWNLGYPNGDSWCMSGLVQGGPAAWSNGFLCSLPMANLGCIFKWMQKCVIFKWYSVDLKGSILNGWCIWAWSGSGILIGS